MARTGDVHSHHCVNVKS